MQFQIRTKTDFLGVNEDSFIEWSNRQECKLVCDFFYSVGSGEAVLKIAPHSSHIGFSNAIQNLIDFCGTNIVD